MVELPDLNYARFEVKIVARTLLELPLSRVRPSGAVSEMPSGVLCVSRGRGIVIAVF